MLKCYGAAFRRPAEPWVAKLVKHEDSLCYDMRGLREGGSQRWPRIFLFSQTGRSVYLRDIFLRRGKKSPPSMGAEHEKHEKARGDRGSYVTRNIISYGQHV